MIKKIVGMAAIVGLMGVGFAATAGAEGITNYPGTKARGMGGAFVAVADDASAVWYNPAAQGEAGLSNLMIEGSNTISITKDSTEGFEADKFTGFASVSWVGEKAAASLFYHNPYRPSFYLNGGNTTGFVDQTIHIYGLGLSGELIDKKETGAFKKVALGATGEWVQVNGNDSELLYNGRTIETEDFTQSSWSGSLGLLTTIFQDVNDGVDGGTSSVNWKIDFGATYRFASTADDIGNGSDEFFSENLVQNKPASWDTGLAYVHNFGLDRLTVSAQYGMSDYSTMSDFFDYSYKKYAFGVEYQLNDLSWIDQLAFRAGINKAEIDEDVDSLYPNDTFSWTAGISVGLPGMVNLDFAYERRSWEFDYSSQRDEDFNLYSASLRWAFGEYLNK